MPPTPIEKLQKFFKLEAERGYDNRAVVGGLDKVLPAWLKEAEAAKLDENLLASVSTRLAQYGDLEPEGRAQSLQSLLDILSEHQARFQPLQNPVKNRVEMPAVDSRSQRMRPENPSPGRRAPNPGRETRPETPVGQGLDAPLTVISGIGPRHAQTLRSLDLNTLGDLLYYFPRRYDDYSQLKTINRLQYGDELTIIATVQSTSNRSLRGGKMQISEAVVSDGTEFLRVNWFNQPWILNKLNTGDQIVLSGKVDMYLGRLVMTNPEWEPVEQEHLHTNRIVPVYSLTARITQRMLRRMMFETVSYWSSRVPEYLPDSIRQPAGLLDLSTALQQVHFPDNASRLDAARHRLAFDEIFLLQFGVLRQRSQWQSVDAQVFDTPETWLAARKQLLPYQLTGAQNRVIEEIRSDLTSGKPMNRLLQGDVGSGKTVVAAMAIEMVVRHGAQTALLAPTSILAEQHYRGLRKLMASEDAGEFALSDSEIRLLTGDTSESDRREIRSSLLDGSIKLIIGTHALLEDPIEFQRLQLVVIDEQHRFGVAQRSALRAKGENPHLLVMTATPIPRSLALTVYGDLDLSVMDEMPAGRQPIMTHVIAPVERERAYQMIRKQLQSGHQAFIIYPLVELGDRDEGKAAVEEHARLQKDIFPQDSLGLLHGRMKPDDKEQVMAKFRDREYQILVSTSVVEVGVDIPNATIMLVEGANRFGLAQLHQFRGRVGRGAAQSYCLLIPETDEAVENERLAVMAETNDGFVLAEKDLDQRGPGDFLGTRQAGFAELKMAKLTDVKLIEKAREYALTLFRDDPDLTQVNHTQLEKMLNRFWGGGKGDIS
jgi:ATP-dependent DNA helicase RecG